MKQQLYDIGPFFQDIVSLKSAEPAVEEEDREAKALASNSPSVNLISEEVVTKDDEEEKEEAVTIGEALVPSFFGQTVSPSPIISSSTDGKVPIFFPQEANPQVEEDVIIELVPADESVVVVEEAVEVEAPVEAPAFEEVVTEVVVDGEQESIVIDLSSGDPIVVEELEVADETLGWSGFRPYNHELWQYLRVAWPGTPFMLCSAATFYYP